MNVGRDLKISSFQNFTTLSQKGARQHGQPTHGERNWNACKARLGGLKRGKDDIY